MLVLIDFQDGDFALGDEEDDSDGGFVACQSDADVGGVGVQQKFPLLVHFEEQITVLDEEFFLVSFGYLHVFFVVGNQFAGFEISVVPQIVAQLLQVDLVTRASLDARSILHRDTRKGDVLVDEGQFLELPLFVDVEHYLSLDFGEQTDVSLEAQVHVFVVVGSIFFEVVEVVLFVFFVFARFLGPIDIILVVVEL